LTTPLEDDSTYYAAQSSGDCEGERLAITITFECFAVRGTVFPFVHEGDSNFNGLFPITVKLYMVPPQNAWDQIDYMLETIPLYTTLATYYDGSIFIPGTPKNPGVINRTDNPGLPINWLMIKQIQGTVDSTLLTGVGDMPTSTIGMYEFEKVGKGDYILEISRQGFITRWAKITVAPVASGEANNIGHREIVPGDVNGNFTVDVHDFSNILKKTSTNGKSKYDPKYDFDANGQVYPSEDNSTILYNIGASYEIYMETLQWLLGF
jgi:hypothetical protein